MRIQRDEKRNVLRCRSRKGFTLVEAMVAMVIFAIISGGVALTTSSSLKSAERQRVVEAEYDGMAIAQAMSLYVCLEGKDPDDMDSLTTKGYIVTGNRSPWGTSYHMEKGYTTITVWTTNSSGERVYVLQ